MRSLPFTPDTSIGMPALVTITRGVQIIRFTTWPSPVTISGTTWNPVGGATVTNIQFPGDSSPATADVTVATDGTVVSAGDGARGYLDGWPISIQLFDSGNPSSGTYDLIPNATIGNVTEHTRGLATISVNGPLNHAKGPITEHYSLTGREDLGDDRCKIPIIPDDIGRSRAYVTANPSGGLLHVSDCYGRVRTGTAGTVEDYANVYYECTTAGTTASTAPTYDPTVGNTTTDGTAVFTARNGWLRYARGAGTGDFTIQLTALPDSRASDDTWFVYGNLYVRSGVLDGFPKIPIRAWDHSTLTLTTFLPISATDIPSDTQFELHPGCDLTREMCNSRFDNIINLRAETFVPPAGNILGL